MSPDKAESDVAADPQNANSRDTGGVRNSDAPDQETTTGTTPTPDYVGRVAGDDIGYAGETGAERRSEEASRGKTAPPDETVQGNPGRPQSDYGSREDDPVPPDPYDETAPI